MAVVKVKLLDRVIHAGIIHQAGQTITIGEDEAKDLVNLGLAKSESAARRILGKGKKDADAPEPELEGDGKSDDGQPESE